MDHCEFVLTTLAVCGLISIVIFGNNKITHKSYKWIESIFGGLGLSSLALIMLFAFMDNIPAPQTLLDFYEPFPLTTYVILSIISLFSLSISFYFGSKSFQEEYKRKWRLGDFL